MNKRNNNKEIAKNHYVILIQTSWKCTSYITKTKYIEYFHRIPKVFDSVPQMFGKTMHSVDNIVIQILREVSSTC